MENINFFYECLQKNVISLLVLTKPWKTRNYILHHSVFFWNVPKTNMQV